MALSADGNTALIGGPDDNGGVGAAWVFTRSAGVWTQQGAKLTGSGATGGPAVRRQRGVVGGREHRADRRPLRQRTLLGAAWVFTRTGGIWTQQGPKLTGTGLRPAPASSATSVALSADGNTALIGGPFDNSVVSGRAWVFTRTGGIWTQQGAKLTGTGEYRRRHVRLERGVVGGREHRPDRRPLRPVPVRGRVGVHALRPVSGRSRARS